MNTQFPASEWRSMKRPLRATLVQVINGSTVLTTEKTVRELKRLGYVEEKSDELVVTPAGLREYKKRKFNGQNPKAT